MATEREASKSAGQLGGQPAIFVYEEGTKTLLSTFENGTRRDLKNESIIGVRSSHSSGRQLLFYAELVDYGDLDLRLESIEAEGLPQAFVREYQVQRPGEVEELGSNPPSSLPARLHVIISTLSGGGKAAAFYEQLLKPFLQSALDLEADKDYSVHATESAESISELTAQIFLPQANKGIGQRIILLSGDGGIIDVLNSLHSAPREKPYRMPSLAVLPMGTGNALAHSYGVTAGRTGGLATLARGVPRQLPIFRARFSSGARLLVDEGRQEESLPLREGELPIMYGAVVCSWGLHAGLVADSDTAEYRKFGAERFKMAAKEALYPSDGSEPHRYKATVSLVKQTADGGEQWTTIDRPDHAYILATMVSQLERNFVISPASKPFDGRLRAVHFGHVNGNEFMRLMNLAYDGGKHVDEDSVSYEDVEGLRIDFQGTEKEPRWRRVCLDGKIVRVEENGWVEVRREQVSVVKLTSLA